MSNESNCPNCGRETIYGARDVPSRGPGRFGWGHLSLLPGLGHFFTPANFTILLCADCGLTRFFADAEACSNLPTSSAWKRVT